MGPFLEKLDCRFSRVGILGGAFDPPHYGHLALAREGLSALDLNAVLFIPASRPPHKISTSASFQQRLAMVKAAIAGHCDFFVSDIESRRCTPSYSVDTLRLLRDKVGPAARFFFLIGVDAFLDMPMWKEFAVIPELAELVVVRRRGHGFSPVDAMSAVFPAYEKTEAGLWSGGNRGRVRFLDLDIPEISSTRIRRILRSGGDAGDMLPAAVIEVIEELDPY